MTAIEETENGSDAGVDPEKSESASTDPESENDEAEPGDGELDQPSSFLWYAVHTYSSFENKVKQAIEHVVTLEGLGEWISQVIIPTEMVVEIKNGKKRTVPRNLMPGYVLVCMEPREECFNLVKNVKGVSSFVGDGHAPVALSMDEVQNLLNIMEDKHEKPKPKMLYGKGDQIRVIEGPFGNFTGQVEQVDEEKGKLTVMVSIFGRPTPVELDVLQVELA